MTGLEARQRPQRVARRPAAQPRARIARLWRHWPLALVLAPGLVLRVLALVAIYPGTWFTDSNGYVKVAATGTLLLDRVSGYSVLVAPFWRLGSAGALIAFQHLLGLALVVLLYGLLVRRGVPRWLAALAVVPVAWDAYVISIEHAIMSDTLFDFTVVVAVSLLLWPERPRLGAIAAAGLLLGYAGLVRSVGAPFVAVFVVYLLMRRLGWRSLVAFAAPWLLMTVGYMALFDVQHGRFALNEWGGRYLYGVVARFADCSRLHGLPADERPFCPDPRHRLTTQAYVWGHASPIHGVPTSAEPQLRDFDLRVIRDRPVTYARLVARSFVHYFEPGHRLRTNDYQPGPWQFPVDPARSAFPAYRGPIRPRPPQHPSPYGPSAYVSRMVSRPHTNAAVSRLLRRYQRYGYTQGLLLAACVLVVLVALIRRGADWRLRLDAALLAAAALAALLVASALSVFSYRYVLTAVGLLPPAAALAGASLLRRRGERRAAVSR